MQGEGHPMLWHLLLYGSYQVTSSKLVLPVLSFLIAAAAMFLFIFRSPLPPWLKAMFVFCGLPIYEYSVMARNYGISMLLLFTFAWIYPLRKIYPIAIGVILALLCNTNIHSLILACLLMSLWLWDTFVEDRSTPLSAQACKLYVAMTILLLGIAVSLYTVWPTEGMLVSDTKRYTNASNMVHGILTTLIAPSRQYGELFPSSVPTVVTSAVLLGSMLGLIVRLPVLVTAYAGFCSLSVFFSVIHYGEYRHLGLFVAFLVSLYWIVFNEKGRPLQHKSLQRIFQAGLYGGLPLLFAFLIWSGAKAVYLDWMYQESASKMFAGFLKNQPEYVDAILVGEPDFFLEAVRYYANNRVYIVREKRFGNTVRLFRSDHLHLSMGELLCAGWHIQQRENKPVLIVLGIWESGAFVKCVGFCRRTFSWSREELADWGIYTKLQGKFAQNVIGDEKYAVYSLTMSSTGQEPVCQSIS